MRYAYIFLALLLVAGCSTPAAVSGTTAPAANSPAPAAPQATYAGEWEVTVSDTPGGTVTGLLSLEEGAEGMTGSFVSGGTTTQLSSVEPSEDGLRIEFYSSEYQTDVYMQFEGGPEATTLSGKTLSTYDTRATRK
ncbi:hypothetical protein GGR28_003680 [Lewinella aquimaris]|uniref:Uncharacterized protein n=1 Tax=Neolewinella aquimaris TaxID=1835722 RepID=A0A840EGV8_9BACT|nr:hypothetical protein [Neolewinella aquimaris]MBB4081039.1 hypothetical protein [Neolewinella aquimaris]